MAILSRFAVLAAFVALGLILASCAASKPKVPCPMDITATYKLSVDPATREAFSRLHGGAVQTVIIQQRGFPSVMKVLRRILAGTPMGQAIDPANTPSLRVFTEQALQNFTGGKWQGPLAGWDDTRPVAVSANAAIPTQAVLAVRYGLPPPSPLVVPGNHFRVVLPAKDDKVLVQALESLLVAMALEPVQPTPEAGQRVFASPGMDNVVALTGEQGWVCADLILDAVGLSDLEPAAQVRHIQEWLVLVKGADRGMPTSPTERLAIDASQAVTFLHNPRSIPTWGTQTGLIQSAKANRYAAAEDRFTMLAVTTTTNAQALSRMTPHAAELTDWTVGLAASETGFHLTGLAGLTDHGAKLVALGKRSPAWPYRGAASGVLSGWAKFDLAAVLTKARDRSVAHPLGGDSRECTWDCLLHGWSQSPLLMLAGAEEAAASLPPLRALALHGAEDPPGNLGICVDIVTPKPSHDGGAAEDWASVFRQFAPGLEVLDETAGAKTRVRLGIRSQPGALLEQACYPPKDALAHLRMDLSRAQSTPAVLALLGQAREAVLAVRSRGRVLAVEFDSRTAQAPGAFLDLSSVRTKTPSGLEPGKGPACLAAMVDDARTAWKDLALAKSAEQKDLLNKALLRAKAHIACASQDPLTKETAGRLAAVVAKLQALPLPNGDLGYGPKRSPKVDEASKRFLEKLKGDVDEKSAGGDYKGEVSKVIQRNWAPLKGCYEEALSEDKGLFGKVSVVFQINKEGRVLEAAIEKTSMKHPAMEACVLEVFRRMSFPPYPNGPVSISYPLAFLPADP